MDDVYFNYRRSSKRISCFLTGSYKEKDKASHSVKFENISRKGASVLIYERLPLEAQFDAEMSTKSLGILSISGKLCWIKKAREGFRYGISFNKELPYDLNRVLNP